VEAHDVRGARRYCLFITLLLSISNWGAEVSVKDQYDG